jgi:hypothetical protein
MARGVTCADGPGSTWPWPLSVNVLGFVAVFVLATGAGLVGLLRAAELTGGLLAVTLAGLLAFLAAALVFHRRIARPISDTRDLLLATVGAGIDIRLALATDPVTIEADHGQVEQVLLNLVRNARDAMPRGGTLTMATNLANLDEGSGLLPAPPSASTFPRPARRPRRG